MIWFEHMRRQRLPLSLPSRVDSDEAETRHQCLDDCFRCLSPRSRDLILAYYGGSRSAKIERRKEIANELGIAPNALWIRAHRIRESLRKCVCECVKGRAR
jgi:DNA-directed RNA polymerase specialized sigma24 family protein